MEYITKQQVILICLLVAIVTSIATAISVVSLTDQTNSPTQTIYRVIETTIDKVANIPAAPDTSPTSTTIPVSPSVLSPADIAKSGAMSMVRIYETASGTKQFAALGVVVGGKAGVLASSLLAANTATSTYVVITPDGKEIPAAYVKGDVGGAFSFFTLTYPSGVAKLPSVALASIAHLKLGDNVVALGGKESGDVVSTGIVSALEPSAGDTTGTNNVVLTDMNLSSAFSGFLLFDTSGNLVALEEGISDADKTARFLNAAVVKAALAGML